MYLIRWTLLVGFSLVLSGCYGGNGYDDLDAFMSDIQAKPKGKVEPLPAFRSYEVFSYSASSLRSPFEPPVKISLVRNQSNSNIKPDPERVKQYLEQFEFDSFSMVGSISNDKGLWGLVRGEDGVHRIQVGDYLGRNHGRITYIDDAEIRLMEIIPRRSGILD